MTKNQIEALKLQETKRHNLHGEKIDRYNTAIKGVSTIGSLLNPFKSKIGGK